MQYFIYCRKSSEEEDRQMLSIDAQLRELRDYATKNQLEVIEEFTEAMTAKAPGRRVFNEMLQELKKGKAQGIISWNPDRLARNSKDGGEIIYLTDRGIIKDLKFPTYLYDDSPHGKFNLSLAFGFSKLFVDNLSLNVKRGLREKIRRGEYPGLPPRGYVNDMKTRTIIAHNEFFEVVKSGLESFALGLVSVNDLRQKFFKAGMQTKAGNPLSHTTIREMLTNPIYYGAFLWKGELCKGSHKPMISKETFDKIQIRLGKKFRIIDASEERRLEKGFLFNELGRCGECGYGITREYHKKKSGLEFRYYKCTKKSKTCNCKQKAINEKDLTPQIEDLVSQIAIDDEKYKLSIAKIQEWKKEEQGGLSEQIQELENKLENNKIKLDKLLDLHLDGNIDSEIYKAKKNKVTEENIEIQTKIDKIQNGTSIWVEPLTNALKVCNQAHHRIVQRDFEQIFQSLKIIGSNRVLFDQVLNVQLAKPFCFLSKGYSGLSTSHKTNLQNKELNTMLESGVQLAESGGGEAANTFCKRQTLTLSSALTVSQPRQPHLAGEAVSRSTWLSAQTEGKVAKGKVRAAGSSDSELLSGVMSEWYRWSGSNRHSLAGTRF